mmetsp:Transcript_72486/g.201009  ORF Transcript_72486/g.201009 Transcript_72486/m.201009 type:complete len:338 (+) Transcript_72486:533-1546(+)
MQPTPLLQPFVCANAQGLHLPARWPIEPTVGSSAEPSSSSGSACDKCNNGASTRTGASAGGGGETSSGAKTGAHSAGGEGIGANAIDQCSCAAPTPKSVGSPEVSGVATGVPSATMDNKLSNPGGSMPTSSIEAGLLAGQECTSRSRKKPSNDKGLPTGASMNVFRTAIFIGLLSRALADVAFDTTQGVGHSRSSLFSASSGIAPSASWMAARKPSRPGGAPKPSIDVGLLAGQDWISRSLKKPSMDAERPTGPSMKVFLTTKGARPLHSADNALTATSSTLLCGEDELPADVLRDWLMPEAQRPPAFTFTSLTSWKSKAGATHADMPTSETGRSRN